MSLLTKKFGIAVRQLRQQRGWSQEELAFQADINRTYLGEIERASAVPSLVTVGKLAAAFDKTPASLLANCE